VFEVPLTLAVKVALWLTFRVALAGFKLMLTPWWPLLVSASVAKLENGKDNADNKRIIRF